MKNHTPLESLKAHKKQNNHEQVPPGKRHRQKHRKTHNKSQSFVKYWSQKKAMSFSGFPLFAELFPIGTRSVPRKRNHRASKSTLKCQQKTGLTNPPKYICHFSNTTGTHIGLKLDIIGFAMARLTECKMEVGRCSPERGVQHLYNMPCFVTADLACRTRLKILRALCQKCPGSCSNCRQSHVCRDQRSGVSDF